MYVYLNSEPGLWTVGHYSPSGQWIAQSDHDSEIEAAERVWAMNGGNAAASDLLTACKARIAFDAKVCEEPGVDTGPLSAKRIEELAREQADVMEMMINAVAKAEGAMK